MWLHLAASISSDSTPRLLSATPILRGTYFSPRSLITQVCQNTADKEVTASEHQLGYISSKPKILTQRTLFTGRQQTDSSSSTVMGHRLVAPLIFTAES